MYKNIQLKPEAYLLNFLVLFMFFFFCISYAQMSTHFTRVLSLIRCVRHVTDRAPPSAATSKPAEGPITTIAPWRTKPRSRRTPHKGFTCKTCVLLKNLHRFSVYEWSFWVLSLLAFTVANIGMLLWTTLKVRRLVSVQLRSTFYQLK